MLVDPPSLHSVEFSIFEPVWYSVEFSQVAFDLMIVVSLEVGLISSDPGLPAAAVIAILRELFL